MNKKKVVLSVVFIFTAVLFFYFIKSGKLISLEKIQENRIYMEQFVGQHYEFSVFLYLFIFVIATIFGVPITIFLTVVAGYFFGVLMGLFYVIVGATAGASVSFLLFRYLFGDFIQKKFAARLANFNKNIEKYGYSYLLSLQFMPITPTFLINSFAGLTKINFITFIWTTIIGIFPGSLLYVLAGRHLAHLRAIEDILTVKWVTILIILSILSFFIPFLRWSGVVRLKKS